MYNKYLALFSFALFLLSCEGNHIPKPKGALRLEYPTPKYKLFENSKCPYHFNINSETNIKHLTGCSVNIEYPKMKATLYISYKRVHKNIDKLLRDAQKLTYEHTIKADNIIANTFTNDSTSVYGTFYEISGNAASQAQFYATDSIQHFIAGSIYFEVKPNYDSIQPAAEFLKKDLRKLMETLQWK